MSCITNNDYDDQMWTKLGGEVCENYILEKGRQVEKNLILCYT